MEKPISLMDTMPPEKLVLGAADYSIFVATLAISALIGVYFQLSSQRKGRSDSSEDFLLAGKDMSILPVAFSLMATFMSTTTLMGIPAEMYLYGTHMAFMNLGFLIGIVVTAVVFLPVYFKNGVSTAYEYLEMRFGKVIKIIISVMFALSMILFTGATLYAPALALSAVTNLSLWMSIVSVGVVCTFYCTLGGMRAVLWADAFQAILMFVGISAIIIQGCLKMGGVYNVFKLANDGGRLVVPEFSFDLSAHYTFFNVLFQGVILTVSTYGGGQLQVQRLLTLKNLKRSKIASIISIPMITTFHLACCLCGLIFYTYFLTCDPLSAPHKPIYSADQLMPYFITSTMSSFPGLPGLCVCGIFSASLSTVSSAVNSLAAVTTEDFLKPLLLPATARPVFYTKITSLIYGVICIGLSFLMASMGNLVRMTILVVGMFAGPNLAVFILAVCTTTANEEGAVVGVLSGVMVAACLSFIPEKRIDAVLPLSNECPDVQYLTPNSTLFTTMSGITYQDYNTTVPSAVQSYASDEKFHLAYMWISSIALVTSLVIGYLTSMISRHCRNDYHEVPKIYLSPVRVWFMKRKEKKNSSIDTISGDVHKKNRPELVIENPNAKDYVTSL